MHRTTRIAAAAAAIGCSTFAASARADLVGTGTYVLEVKAGNDPDNSPFCALAMFDGDVPADTHNVFGTDVNLGVEMPQGMFCTGGTVGGVKSPDDCKSVDTPSEFAILSNPLVACLNPGQDPCFHESFITDPAASFSGTIVTGLGPDLAFTMDGEHTWNGQPPGTSLASYGCTIAGSVYHANGSFSVNAFQTAATTVGTDQTVTFDDTTFLNPATGEQQQIDLSVSFSEVTGGGTTTVTASSNSAAEVPSNFAFSYNGFQTTFLEISTTAAIQPPIVICTTYADSDPDDGIVDGTTVPEGALTFLHGENGEFIDRTSSRDSETNTICATVDSLSPFAVMVNTNGVCSSEGETCDDGNVCTTVDVCDSNLDCVGTVSPNCDDGTDCTIDGCIAPTTGCAHAPALYDCNESAAKAKLSIKDSSDDAKDQFQFQWGSGTSMVGDFGDPTTSSEYLVCVFDHSDRLLLSAKAPAGTMCGDVPCWTKSDKGVKYADKAKPPGNDGIKQISGAGSLDVGKAKLQIKAGGEPLPLVSIGDIEFPVRAQVRTSNAGCWEQDFVSTDVKANDASQLKLGHSE